jgi:hypothetical protein
MIKIMASVASIVLGVTLLMIGLFEGLLISEVVLVVAVPMSVLLVGAGLRGLNVKGVKRWLLIAMGVVIGLVLMLNRFVSIKAI